MGEGGPGRDPFAEKDRSPDRQAQGGATEARRISAHIDSSMGSSSMVKYSIPFRTRKTRPVRRILDCPPDRPVLPTGLPLNLEGQPDFRPTGGTAPSSTARTPVRETSAIRARSQYSLHVTSHGKETWILGLRR